MDDEAEPVGVHWFVAALFWVAVLHIVLALVLGLASGLAAGNLPIGDLLSGTGAMGMMMVIISTALFLFLGGATHLLLGAMKLRVWWSYLLAGLLIGGALGAVPASIGLPIPNATGPYPNTLSVATQAWIVVTFAGWSALNAMIGWWSWRRRAAAEATQ
jgi:hypothetical protein